MRRRGRHHDGTASDRQRRRPCDRARAPLLHLAAGEVPRARPPAAHRGHRGAGVHGREVRHHDGPGRAAHRLVDLRGPEVPVQAEHRRRRLRPRRHDPGGHHPRRDAARLLGPRRTPQGHGPQPRRGLPLLPDLPALLRADLRRGARQGGRPRLCARLQRLDGRGVVRRQRRPADPALHHPALGHRPRRRRDPPQRGPGRARGHLLRDPHVPRPPVHPHRLLGPVLRRLPGDRHGRQHAHRLQLPDARRLPGRAPGRARPRSPSTTRWPR